MHIPDGYLSPKTCAVFYALMAPIWYLSAKKIQKTLQAREIPMIALCASFVFVIMMFNIPIPGGSTGHIVGGVILASIIGPWAGVISLSIAIAIQAVLFGDGGITTLGANCFNIAFIMPFSGYYIYHLVAAGNASKQRRRAALFIAGYIAINITALATAVELGIQPIIASSFDGTPLYAPYPLSVTIPAISISHLLFFGFIEGIGTVMVVSYILKTNKALLYKPETNPLKPLWVGLIILIILTPIGLLAQGSAWGEWTAKELLVILGYLPKGIRGFDGLWTSVMSNYNFSGWNSPAGRTFSYIFSAALGSGIIVMFIYIAGKIWKKK